MSAERIVAHGTLVVGFGSVVGGVAMWSIPSAMVIGGLVLFVGGGLALRQLAMRAAPKAGRT